MPSNGIQATSGKVWVGIQKQSCFHYAPLIPVERAAER